MIRKTIEDKILYILFSVHQENINGQLTTFDILRNHKVSFEMFNSQTNQDLYKCIQNMMYAGLTKPDLISVIKYRPKNYTVFEQQSSQYLAMISEILSSTYASFSELEILIHQLKEFNYKDFWNSKGTQIVTTNMDNVDIFNFGNQIINDYTSFSQMMTSGVNQVQRKTDAEILKEKVKNRNLGIITSLPTEIAEIDRHLLGGFEAPDLIVIGARPGMGKTSFGLAIVWNIAKKNKHLVFVSLEASKGQVKDKIASRLTGIDYNDIQRGRLTPEQEDFVIQAYEHIDKFNLTVLDISNQYIEDIYPILKKLFLDGKLEGAFIDYFQILKTRHQAGSREQEVAHIGRTLKTWALEFNIPIIALAQLKRSNAGKGARPKLEDLRESGSIEQDADIVAFIYRENYYTDPSVYVSYEVQFQTEIIWAKGRNIGLGISKIFLDVKKLMAY